MSSNTGLHFCDIQSTFDIAPPLVIADFDAITKGTLYRINHILYIIGLEGYLSSKTVGDMRGWRYIGGCGRTRLTVHINIQGDKSQ